MKKFLLFVISIIISSGSFSFAQKHGNLIIVGGRQVTSIMKKFADLAGGKDARIVIIPNAGSEPELNGKIQVKEFKELGAKSEYLLFTRETADKQENLDKVAKATAVFFLGGDQSDLTRDMLGTKLLEKVFELYNKGGLVGGSSAGAAVMSEIMLTGNELINKDSSVSFVSILKGNVETKQGFGFLKNEIIDQHFLKRKRHNRFISVMLENPKYLGIAIDESTAINVKPDNTFEVFGDNQVIIYDPTSSKDVHTDKNNNLAGSGLKMHILVNGDKFDLKTKKVIK